LGVAKLLGTFSKGAIVPGPLSTGNPASYDANLKKGLSVISDCLRMFQGQLESHWKTGDGPGGYLCTNNGIRAIFHVIKDISDHVRQKSGVDLYLLSADEAFREISPYLQAVIDFFKIASTPDILAFRRIGSSLTAVKQQSYGLEVHIHKKFGEFNPPGLKEYVESRDEAGTEEARQMVVAIEKRLFNYIVRTLKENYGTQNKAWWTQGIPLGIRKECTAAWEEKNRIGEEESQLYLINFMDIFISNWDLFKDVISLDKKNKDNKKANTSWIKDLNEIRNKTMHPVRGPLSTQEVAFAKDIFEKVQSFVPDENAQRQSVV
jgi:hypothetical protein